MSNIIVVTYRGSYRSEKMDAVEKRAAAEAVTHSKGVVLEATALEGGTFGFGIGSIGKHGFNSKSSTESIKKLPTCVVMVSSDEQSDLMAKLKTAGHNARLIVV